VIRYRGALARAVILSEAKNLRSSLFYRPDCRDSSLRSEWQRRWRRRQQAAVLL